MAYANTRVPYSGGPQIFETGFGLGVLSTENLVVTVDGVVDGLGEPAEFSFTYNTASGQVTVLDSIAASTALPAIVDIRRVTPVDTLAVDFEAGADVTKRNLNRAVVQALMATQETRDSLSTLDIRMGSVEGDLGTIDAAVSDTVTARDKAQEWAENPVDYPVETGQYSALHHATKAGEHEAGALLAAGAAEQSAINSALNDPTLRFQTLAEMIASDRGPAVVGAQWQAGVYLYRQLPLEAATWDVSAGSGASFVPLEVVDTGQVPDSAFFTATNVDDTGGLQKYFDWCYSKGRNPLLVQRNYTITDTVTSRVRVIDGRTNYVDSANPGTRVRFIPTVLTDLKPGFKIVSGMARGGVVRGITVVGNQPYSMRDAEIWCPNPELLPSMSAFAVGPAAFEVTGNCQVEFDHVGSTGVKIGVIYNSDSGHIIQRSPSLSGWLGSIYVKKNTQDFQFNGGSLGGVYANIVLGLDGCGATLDNIQLGFAAYPIVQLEDGVNPGTEIKGFYGILGCNFEQVGECLMSLLPNSNLSGLLVEHWGMTWSTIYTGWETAPPAGWASNLHPHIKAYADQQKYALSLGDVEQDNVLRNRVVGTLIRSPNNPNSKIARVRSFRTRTKPGDSDFSALRGSVDVTGTRGNRWTGRGGASVRMDDLMVRSSGILAPNLLKAPEIVTNWSNTQPTLTTLATVGVPAPQQMVDELGVNPAVIAIAGGTLSTLTPFGGTLAAQPGRVLGWSYWSCGRLSTRRLSYISTARYQMVVPDEVQWTKYVHTGMDHNDGLLSALFDVASGANLYIAGLMAFFDEVKPYNPSPAPYKPGGFPTSATGLPADSLWSNAGVLTVAT